MTKNIKISSVANGSIEKYYNVGGVFRIYVESWDVTQEMALKRFIDALDKEKLSTLGIEVMV